MTELWKLTSESHETYGGCKWGVGVEHTAAGTGALCTSGWLHAYLSPELAVLLNPIHSNIEKPVLWRADGDVGLADGQLKVGCTRLRTIGIVPLPKCATEQRVRFAILCALEVYFEPGFVKWATDWLDGSNRTAPALPRRR